LESVHVVLVYSLREQKLVDLQEFDNDHDAHVAYVALEREHLFDSDVEIVLVAADSIDTIKATHGSYFDEDISLESLGLRELLAQ